MTNVENNSDNAEQIKYWNAKAGAIWVAQQAHLDHLLAPLSEAGLAAAKFAANESALDVGCGCGDTSIALGASQSSGSVTGVDISEPMLAHAQVRADAMPNVSFEQADAAIAEFSNQYNLVFSRFGVMFFADPEAAFKNLRKALKRSNLTLLKKVTAQKVLFNGKQATGIEYLQGGQIKQVHANTEVILSAGSVGSPHLLQLSGIGPAQVLADAQVPLVHDLPGVGENLQDHLEVYFQYRCKQPISLNSKLDYFNMGLIGARWLLTKTGLGATNHFESCGFIRSRAGLKWPNIQYHFLPAAMRYDGNAAFDGHGYQVHVGPNKPSSRGHIRIVSNQASDAPKITFNYITTEQDKQDWRDCIRLTRELLNQPSLDPFKGEEIQPGAKVQTDDEIDAWVKTNVESAYHPSCTCKMGADDDVLAVLDNECKVRGVSGLRVVDSSIFPVITNGNLNAPTIMVAEKAADLILGKTPLAPTNAKVWIADQWHEKQRTGSPLRALDSAQNC